MGETGTGTPCCQESLNSCCVNGWKADAKGKTIVSRGKQFDEDVLWALSLGLRGQHSNWFAQFMPELRKHLDRVVIGDFETRLALRTGDPRFRGFIAELRRLRVIKYCAGIKGSAFEWSIAIKLTVAFWLKDQRRAQDRGPLYYTETV